jgi:hypothetical protein
MQMHQDPICEIFHPFGPDISEKTLGILKKAPKEREDQKGVNISGCPNVFSSHKRSQQVDHARVEVLCFLLFW